MTWKLEQSGSKQPSTVLVHLELSYLLRQLLINSPAPNQKLWASSAGSTQQVAFASTCLASSAILPARDHAKTLRRPLAACLCQIRCSASPCWQMHRGTLPVTAGTMRKSCKSYRSAECSLFSRRNNSQRNTLLPSYKPGLAEAEERLELLMQKPLQQLS